MAIQTKRGIVRLFATAPVGIIGLGCNTANGFEKDLQKAGRGIQNGTK
jgi:predicted small secreted protein